MHLQPTHCLLGGGGAQVEQGYLSEPLTSGQWLWFWPGVMIMLVMTKKELSSYKNTCVGVWGGAKLFSSFVIK